MPVAIVSGALANKPHNGGATWTRLSWALGLAKLGYDVHFIEEIAASTCVDAHGRRCDPEDSINLSYFRSVAERFELDASLIVMPEGRVIGRPADDLPDIAQAADLLLNISGNLTFSAVKDRVSRRVFIDLDPGYTQFWHADGLAVERLSGHHFYFTVGENIGHSCCAIPSGGIEWRPTRQPVLLDEWPVVPESSLTRFTTIASWRGPLGRVRSGETSYGVKAHEFRKFAAVPAASGQRFEMALEVDAADQADATALTACGWSLVDPKAVVPDPDAFRRYIQGSGAEFSVAQGIYVETESGWFSDRSVRYLASGKPVLVQDTGWSRNYPSDRGLVAFRTFEEAVAGAERIASDYGAHARAARRHAEEFFDSNRVLTELLAVVAA